MHDSTPNHALQRPTAGRRSPHMKIAPARFCVVALFAIPCVLTSAAELSPIPQRFSAHIGGFMGASYSVELHDGLLTYTIFGKGHINLKQETITPTEAQWREFRQTLDDLRIWQWRTEGLLAQSWDVGNMGRDSGAFCAGWSRAGKNTQTPAQFF